MFHAPDIMWTALGLLAALGVGLYALWRIARKAPTRDDWPHDDSLGG